MGALEAKDVKIGHVYLSSKSQMVKFRLIEIVGPYLRRSLTQSEWKVPVGVIVSMD